MRRMSVHMRKYFYRPLALGDSQGAHHKLHSIIPFFLFSLLILSAFPFRSSSQTVPFEPGRWNLSQAKVSEERGRDCLSGTAFLNGVKLKDGVIDVDLLVTGKEANPGIFFRKSAEGEFERISLRPHRAGRSFDAVQYSPVFNGSDAWQLYSGPGYTASCELPTDNWVHLRLEFRDSQARLFVDGSRTPALVVHDLNHNPVHGTLGLDAPQDGSAYFSRFSYREAAELEFPPAPTVAAIPGAITRWEISSVFKPGNVDVKKTPSQQDIEAPGWMTVESEESGLVNVARYRKRSDADPACIWARVILKADDDVWRELKFGYSDAISIFCNGRLLYTGNSAYQQRDPSFLGITGYFDSIYLPLEDGENELMVCVSDSTGGWGFMAKE
jgi:hypothetical protein